MIDLDRQFRNVVSSPLSSLSVEEFKPIVLGIWYEGYTPNLDQMKSDELRKAGYLVDRLMRFNCVCDDRKLELMELVEEVKYTLGQKTQVVSSKINVEPLARKWNLNEDISFIVQSLLEYQTRHYVHTPQQSSVVATTKSALN